MLHEYALKLLLDSGCDIHTYGDLKTSEEQLVDELKTAFPDGLDYEYADVAKAILEISKPSVATIPVVGFDFDDWGRWNFDEDTLAELETAVKSGKPFNTGWHGWSKDEDMMAVVRDYDMTVVRCSSEMDEGVDLINDCLVGDEYIADDETYEKILDVLNMEHDFSSHEESKAVLPVDASLNDILSAAEKLFESVHHDLDESFKFCIGTTLQVLYGDSEETSKLYMERIKLFHLD